MSIPASIIKDAVGSLSTGPAGFAIELVIPADAPVTPGATAIEAKVDEQSLARAKAQNDSGLNKNFAAEMKPAPKGAEKALALDSSQRGKMADRVDAVRARSGATFIPRPGARRDLRSALANPTNPAPSQRSPSLVQRIQKRQYLQVRRTLDEILKRKSVALNPETVEAKAVEVAVQKGERFTPFGEVPTKNHKGPKDLRAAYSKWGHALQAGSYFEGPSLKNKA